MTVAVIITLQPRYNMVVYSTSCGLVVSAPAWDGTGYEFDSWHCPDIYPMFIEPMITWVLSGLSGYIWLDTKLC